MASGTSTAIEPYRFDEPLREGLVLARPNRFIMDVLLDGEHVRCHCPVTSRIGGIDTAGRPCLVSRSPNPRRKFALTVEALSLDEPDDPAKEWVGINQTASNRYVEHFLRQGALAGIAGPGEVRREVPLGASRLDFCVGEGLFLEVKTPLAQLERPLPAHLPRLDAAPFASIDRAVRHLRELAGSLRQGQRAAILYCLYYRNQGFRFYRGVRFDEMRRTVEEVQAAGVELWQADFRCDAHQVALERSFPLVDW